MEAFPFPDGFADCPAAMMEIWERLLCDWVRVLRDSLTSVKTRQSTSDFLRATR